MINDACDNGVGRDGGSYGLLACNSFYCVNNKKLMLGLFVNDPSHLVRIFLQINNISKIYKLNLHK